MCRGTSSRRRSALVLLLQAGGVCAAPGLAVSSDEAEECRGWQSGTLDTWLDKELDAHRRNHHSISGGFTSQHRQDKQMWLALFKDGHLSRGRQHTYADLAANHYKRISNTYFFDRCAGWRGLCFEPNPMYHADLLSRRSCELIPTCVSNHTNHVDFAWPRARKDAGVDDQWRAAFGGITGGSRSFPSEFERKELQCVRLGDVLSERRWRHLDLLSLDVEGHEKEVLGGIDLSQIHIDFILCEGTCGEVLAPLGYTGSRLKMAGGDILWARPGYPAALLANATDRGFKLH